MMTETWTEAPLAQCMSKIIDYRGKSPNKTSHGIPLITAKIVKGGRIETPEEFIDPSDYDGWMRRGLPKAGDVLITTEAPLGEVAQLDGRKVALAQRLIALRPTEGLLDSGYLCYLLQSEEVQADLRSRASGTTVLGIKQSELRLVPLRFPSLPTQRTVARILRALDDKIELNRRTSETLEAMARALFQSWFVDFDPVRAKMEGRKPEGMDAETAKLFPSRLVHLMSGEVPDGWAVLSIGDLAELQRGTTYKSPLIGHDGPVLLGLASIKRDGGFRSDSLRTYGGESPEKLLVRPGELFASLKDVTQSGDLLGSVARVPPTVKVGRLTQDTVKLVLRDPDPGGSDFLYWTLRTPEFRVHCRAHAMGTTNLSLSREDFLGYRIAVPPAPVLSRLMAFISALDRKADDQSASQTLVVLRDTLLPKLLAGELRIPDAERAVSAAL